MQRAVAQRIFDVCVSAPFDALDIASPLWYAIWVAFRDVPSKSLPDEHADDFVIQELVENTRETLRTARRV